MTDPAVSQTFYVVAMADRKDGKPSFFQKPQIFTCEPSAITYANRMMHEYQADFFVFRAVGVLEVPKPPQPFRRFV